MKEYEKNPEEMERDVERARAEVSAKIDQIQSRLSPGEIMDQAIGYLRTSLPAEFGQNLSDAVRTNPVPVALIGVGIAWLAISGRNGASPARYSDEADRYRGRSTDDLGENWEFTRGSANDDTDGRSLGDRAGDGASDMAEQAARGIRDTIRSARDSVRSARDTMHRASDRTRDTYDRARSSMANARASAADMIEDQPLLLGALGLAVGAGLGASLPRTRVEDELMGDTRDDLMHGAAERAREYADRAADTARDYAGRAADTAREKIDQVGDGQPGSRSSTTSGSTMGSSAGANAGAGIGASSGSSIGTPGAGAGTSATGSSAPSSGVGSGVGGVGSSDRSSERQTSSHATANAPGRSNTTGSGSSSTSTSTGARSVPGFGPSDQRPK